MGHLFRCITFALVLANTPAIAAEPVDLLLVLAADVSRSVDSQKFQLQREGYAAAMANPRVVDAIRSGRHGRIGVLFLEWSGFGSQKVVIDWMIIDGPKAGQAFGDRLLESPRSAVPSTFQATEPTMRGVTSPWRGTRRSPSALQSTDWRFSAKRRCPGIQSTPTRPAVSPSTIVTTSLAAPAVS